MVYELHKRVIFIGKPDEWYGREAEIWEVRQDGPSASYKIIFTDTEKPLWVKHWELAPA